MIRRPEPYYIPYKRVGCLAIACRTLGILALLWCVWTLARWIL